jgi:hypothetical protein
MTSTLLGFGATPQEKDLMWKLLGRDEKLRKKTRNQVSGCDWIPLDRVTCRLGSKLATVDDKGMTANDRKSSMEAGQTHEPLALQQVLCIHHTASYVLP